MVECPVRNLCWSEVGSKCVLTVVSMRASITFAAGQSNEIGRYEVPRVHAVFGDRDDNRLLPNRRDST